jgi:hypothetical protein
VRSSKLVLASILTKRYRDVEQKCPDNL